MTSTLGPMATTFGGADEHGVERAIEFGHVEFGLEAVDLAAVAIALYRDIDRPEAQLVGAPIEHLGGQQDHSRTCAEHRQAVAEHRLDLVEQPGGLQQPRHGRAFAARDHERVDAGEIARLANLSGRRTSGLEGALMGDERALQCEHTDEPIGPANGRHDYQPRSAYR